MKGSMSNSASRVDHEERERESTPLVLKKYCTNMVGCCALEEVGFAASQVERYPLRIILVNKQIHRREMLHMLLFLFGRFSFLNLEWFSPLGNSSDGRGICAFAQRYNHISAI